ncbi:MAG: hypothetical protein WBA13_09000 [Microcoleaceae cyanobacterium]
MVNVSPNKPSSDIPASVTRPWIDPNLLWVARRFYREYFHAHSQQMRRPWGIVVHRRTQRAAVIFSHQPILLWDECFIPFEQIESELS